MLHATAVVGEPCVVEELVEVERVTEALEERVVGAADVHESVLRAERLVRDDGRVDVPLRPRDRPVREVTRGLAREQRDLAADHRRVDHLALAGPVPRLERGDDREGGEHPRDHVGLWHADHDRIAAGLAGQAHHPTHALDHEVVGRPRTPGAVLPESGDMADDRAPVHRADPVVRAAESCEDPGAEVLDDDVRAFDEPLEDRLAVGMLQVAGHAPLVPVDREVVRRHAVDRGRRPLTRLVTGSGYLDLHDVGAVVREQQRAVGARECPGEVHDADALERSRRAAADRGKEL